MQLSISDLWRETLDAVQAEFGNFLVLAAAFVFLPNLVVGRLAPDNAWLGIAAGLIGMLAQLAIMKMVIERNSDVRGALQRAGEVFLPAFAVAVISGFVATMGGLLLRFGSTMAIVALLVVLAGLYIAVRLSMATPMLVAERRDVLGALRSSWETTQPHVWRILAFLLLLSLALIFALVVLGLVGNILTNLGAVGKFLAALLVSAAATVFAILVAAAIATIYRQLRVGAVGPGARV